MDAGRLHLTCTLGPLNGTAVAPWQPVRTRTIGRRSRAGGAAVSASAHPRRMPTLTTNGMPWASTSHQPILACRSRTSRVSARGPDRGLGARGQLRRCDAPHLWHGRVSLQQEDEPRQGGPAEVLVTSAKRQLAVTASCWEGRCSRSRCPRPRSSGFRRRVCGVQP